MKRLCGLVVVLGLLVGVLGVPAQAAGPEVPAKSAVLMDIATGTVIVQSESHTPLAPASVTKVMTMLLIMEAIDDGRIGWTDTVTTSETAAAKGGSQIYLKVGETMCVEDMVKAIAVSSANDCACAMAEHLYGSEAAFVEKMNARAKELGMENTHFVNCTGLDDSPEAAQHRTTAYDIALMSRQLLKYHPDITRYTTIWMDTVRGGTFGLSNTNKLIRFYAGATGLKTGFTSGAGYCLSASAQRDGLGLIAVVMGCATSTERLAACKTLLDYGFANYALAEPELPSEAAVPVRLGTAGQVSAVPGDYTPVLIEKAQKSLVHTALELDPEVTAPVSQGQRLGTLRIQAGEQILAEIPMLAATPVERITWDQMFLRLLRTLAFSE